MANPTSDFDKAGASLVPSPVTATMFFKDLNPNTKAYLCKGCERAMTFKLLVIALKLSIFLIISFLTGFGSSPFRAANSLASAAVFGHLHKLVSF